MKRVKQKDVDVAAKSPEGPAKLVYAAITWEFTQSHGKGKKMFFHRCCTEEQKP